MNTKGQNIVEYILLVAVVIAAFIIFHNPKKGPMKEGLHETLGSFDTAVKGLNKEISFDSKTPPEPLHSKPY